MDAKTKQGIEEMLKLNESEREKVYKMLEERTSEKAVNNFKAIVKLVSCLKQK